MLSVWPQHFIAETDLYDLKKISLSEVFFKVNEEKTPYLFIERKEHVRFLNEYLGTSHGLGATYIIAERNYISKDYLTDYASYYASTFNNYSKLCVRLHFFSLEVDAFSFINLFKSSVVEGINKTDKGGVEKKYKDFWERDYLGYLVIKPTPNFFIGFTLLKHYNYHIDKSFFKASRNYWGIKDYKVNVYGNEVIVPSLAFQEQDRNVAACATIAIWSMLQRAAEDYYVILQSPGEITRRSGIVAHDGNRLIPNKGLSLLQMAQTITKNNMATEVRNCESYRGKAPYNLYLKKIIHAYSTLKIPIIFAIKIHQSSDETVGHAVAIIGNNMESIETINRKFNLFSLIAKFKRRDEILWKAEGITKIYVHDDQWGPFSTMHFSGRDKLNSSWNLYNPSIKKLSNSYAVIIPVYQKVRIPYEDIEVKVLGLNAILTDHLSDKIEGELNWDIQIFLSEDFKHIIQEGELYNDSIPSEFDLKLKFLTRNFPKYIWVATLSIDNINIFHFKYDATGLSGSNLLHTIVGYYSYFTNVFIEILEKNNSNTDHLFTSIFDFDIEMFIKKLKEFN